MRPVRLIVGVLLVVGVLWLAGTAYVLAVNGSWKFQRPTPAEVVCSGAPDGGRPPALPARETFFPTETLRLAHALGDPATSGLPRWPGLFDATPKAYDIDGDGTQELIAHSNDTSVYVFNAQTGRALAVLDTTCPGGWYIERILNGVEAASLRPGEPTTLIVTNHAAYVTAWRFVPAESKADRFAFERVWETRVNECFIDAGMDAKPTLADLDEDGTLEILVQTEERGFFALNADGSKRWGHCWAGGNSEPVADDLDGDGDVEAVFASDSGFLAVLDGNTGDPHWTFDAAKGYGVSPASIAVSPVVAELDGKAPRELLFTARQAPSGDATLFPTFHMAIFAVHQNLSTWQAELLWMRQPEWAHPLSYTRLAVGDVDADGSPDIFGMDWNTIGHLPGNWELLGPAHAFRLDARGEDVWVREVDSWWSNKEVALGDFDGDGRPDLLVNAALEGQDGLLTLSADTGERGVFLPAWPWKLMRGPSLFDLRGDGDRQIVFPATPDVQAPSHGALFVFEIDPI